MIIKFEVGKVYWSREFRYARDGNTLKETRDYWLCVKRNDRTGYVSFSRYYKAGGLSSIVESRKARSYHPYEYQKAGKRDVLVEEISIGYGGSGAWRNHHVIRADQTKE